METNNDRKHRIRRENLKLVQQEKDRQARAEKAKAERLEKKKAEEVDMVFAFGFIAIVSGMAVVYAIAGVMTYVLTACARFITELTWGSFALLAFLCALGWELGVCIRYRRGARKRAEDKAEKERRARRGYSESFRGYQVPYRWQEESEEVKTSPSQERELKRRFNEYLKQSGISGSRSNLRQVRSRVDAEKTKPGVVS